MKLSRMVLGFAVIGSFAACAVPAKATGGGWLVGATGEEKANFGFNADSCDGTLHGNLNYHDRSVDLKVNGEVLTAGLCDDLADDETLPACINCLDGEYQIEFAYESTNPANPGSGTAVACFGDQVFGADDTLFLAV